MSDEMVRISKKEYESLLNDSQWLCALEAAGVDNWDGYEDAQDAMELIEQSKKEKELLTKKES